MKVIVLLLGVLFAYSSYGQTKTACEAAAEIHLQSEFGVSEYSSLRVSHTRNDEGRLQSVKATIKPVACSGTVVVFFGPSGCSGANKVVGACGYGDCKQLKKGS